MSTMAGLYLGGMALVFVGERLLSGAEDGLGWVVSWVGVALVGAAFAFAVRRYRGALEPGQRLGYRAAGVLLLVGFAGLVVYLGTTDGVVETFGLEGESERRWRGVWGALWPIFWLVGTIPFLLVDRALWRSPEVLPERRVRAAVAGGLAAALGFALAFPVNFLATRHNERWDLTYFKTSAAGTATVNIVAALDKPINVRIFAPSASDLADELRGYFSALEGLSLTVEVLDQAASPRLAKALQVRDNGVITFTLGDIVFREEGETTDPDAPRPVTKRFEVGKDLDRAKRKLERLDEEVQKILLELGQADRVVYFTQGHGELGWEGRPSPDRGLSGLKRFFQAMHFRVETLSLANGLDSGVPEDADLVAIVGPREPFEPAEVDSIRMFVESGGAALVAHEPEGARADDTLGQAREDALAGWINALGIRPGRGMLAAEGGFVPVWHEKRDRTNLVTNLFSIHPSTKVLAERSARVMLFHPGAGFWDNVDGAETKVVITVRSLPISWADVNDNLEFDEAAGETKSERSLVAAITGGESESAWRVLALADASMLSDLALGNLGNQQFVHDGVNWLIGAEALSGTTENEEDVKIEHTKEDQTAWFYGTVLGIPLLVLGLGALRVRSRRQGGVR